MGTAASITGTGNISTDTPMLGLLADNGGPTFTHASLSGSPAINAGDPSTTFSSSEFDQRGLPFSRFSNRRIDIGAFESQTLSLEVDNASDMVDGDYGDNEFTLREAIELANANPGDDTITFDSSISDSTITLDGSELEITDSVTITGPGADLLTIDAGNGDDGSMGNGDGFQIFVINDGEDRIDDGNGNVSGVIDVELRGMKTHRWRRGRRQFWKRWSDSQRGESETY